MSRETLLIIALAVVAAAALGGGIMISRKWPGQAPDEYRNAIAAAELREGLPHDLLARLLWQESHYRPEIINGSVASPAGALGIAQIVPRWHPGVDPLDPFASIDYAARYLRDLRRQTGSWKMALAAYNWGIGNLLGKGWNMAPLETRNYVADISGDLPGLV